MSSRERMPARIARNYTKRQWQQKKRQEVKELRRFFSDTVKAGCIHTPCYEELLKIEQLIENCEKKMSVKNWKGLYGPQPTKE